MPIYKIDSQQGPTIEYGELYSIFYNFIREKNLTKNMCNWKNKYTCISESLCCTPKTNTL